MGDERNAYDGNKAFFIILRMVKISMTLTVMTKDGIRHILLWDKIPWFSFNIKDVYLVSQFKLGFSIRPPSFLNKAHVKVYNYVSMLHRIASYLSQSSPYFNRDMNIHKCLRSFYECFMMDSDSSLLSLRWTLVT